MLQIKSQGLSLSALNEQPIQGIIELFFKYKSETRDEVLNGMGRVLSLASDVEAVLEKSPDKKYVYSVSYVKRRATFMLYKKCIWSYGEDGKDYFDTMHPLEVLRITETEEGR